MDGTQVACRELRTTPGVTSSPTWLSQKTAKESGDPPGDTCSAAEPTWPRRAQPAPGPAILPTILMHTHMRVTDHEAWFLAQELWSLGQRGWACHHTLALGNKVAERAEKDGERKPPWCWRVKARG